MSTINSKTARELLEAYHAVYQTEETISEEQLWEEVENWVFDGIHQGVDFSAYSLDEIAEAFLEDVGYLTEDEYGRAGRNTGAALRSTVKGAVKGALDTAGSYYRGLVGKKTTSTNPAARLANTASRNITAGPRFTARFVQGALTGKGSSSPAKTKPESKFGRLGRDVQKNAPKNEPMVLRGVDGKPLGKPSKQETTPSKTAPAPAPSRTPAPTPAPAPSRTPAPTAAAKTAPAPTAAAKTAPAPAKKKTPNPLMQKTFGYQTGGAPGQSGFKKATTTPNVSGMKSGRLATAISGPNKKIGEGYDAYDIVLNYIAENGHAESLDEAHYIMMEMSPEMIQDIVEAMSNYEKNRKRAAQRAAARNEARRQGKTGAVPGVGYVTPRMERETWTDESGQERHTSGARMPKKDKK